MQVGTFIRLKKQNYVIVNKQGTYEKLNQIKWYLLLYFEIIQGLGMVFSINKIRRLCEKH